eukprot:3315906-Prymnesium_polylepis.1
MRHGRTVHVRLAHLEAGLDELETEGYISLQDRRILEEHASAAGWPALCVFTARWTACGSTASPRLQSCRCTCSQPRCSSAGSCHGAIASSSLELSPWRGA